MREAPVRAITGRVEASIARGPSQKPIVAVVKTISVAEHCCPSSQGNWVEHKTNDRSARERRKYLFPEA